MTVRIIPFITLAVCLMLSGQILRADEAVLLSVETDLPPTAVAGDSVEVSIKVLIAADEPEPLWETYDGPLDVWYVDFVPNAELEINERQFTVFTIDIVAGETSFTWIPTVAGGNRLHYRLPGDATAHAQSAVIHIAPGAASEPVVAQFERSMQFMEFDPDSELSQWITNGCTTAGSTTLFVTWHDQFGNVCPIGSSDLYPEGSELQLELICDDPELEGCEMGFTVAFLEDDGYESIEEASQCEVFDKFYEISDDDGDAFRDSLDRILNGQASPGQVFSLATFQPRLHASSFAVRIIGWVGSPPPSSSFSFALQLKIGGTIQGATVSGTGSIQAQLGTMSGTIGDPYLTNYTRLNEVDYGTDHVYAWNLQGNRRWAGTAAWWTMDRTTNGIELQFNKQPEDMDKVLAELAKRVPSSAPYVGLPGSSGAVAGTWRDDMGGPCSYGESFVTVSGVAAWGSNHAQSTDHYARRAWRLEVAFHQGSQPTHVIDGRVYRHSAGFSHSWSASASDAHAHASWSVRGWGASFDAASQALAQSSVETRDGAWIALTSVSIGLPASIGVTLEATNGLNQSDDQQQYSKAPYLISERGLIMTAGFSVGWAMDSRVSTNGLAHAGWFDVVQVAPVSTPAVGASVGAAGVVYSPGSLASYDWAFVRVGYSAPGTGGIVWTAGRWLQ